MTLTIALAQLKGNLYDKPLNIERAISTMEECKEKGADLVLFPELFLSGYSIQDRIELEEMAERVDGESIQMFREKAKEIGIGVILGFAEKSGSHFYNSAAFIEKTGKLKGVYRKIHIFNKEQELFSAGEDCPVFETELGRIAIMMTFDLEFPELARIYAIHGAEIIMVLNAHQVPFEAHQQLYLRTRALENQIFIAAANRVGLEKSTLFFGESAVVSPDGNFVARGGNNDEVIVVSIDLQDVYRTRAAEPMKYLENRKNKLYQKKGLLS